MLTSEINCIIFIILYTYLFLFPLQIRAGKYENVEKVNKMLKNKSEAFLFHNSIER